MCVCAGAMEGNHQKKIEIEKSKFLWREQKVTMHLRRKCPRRLAGGGGDRCRRRRRRRRRKGKQAEVRS